MMIKGKPASMAQLTKHYLESLKDHELVLLESSAEKPNTVRRNTYRLGKKNGGSAYCFFMAFLPCDVIAIYGDFAPGENGVLSRHGYNEEWLLGSAYRDPHYLAEKFLSKGYDSSLAEYEASQHLEGRWDGEKPTGQEKDFWQSVLDEGSSVSQVQLMEFAEQFDFDIYDLSIGYGYDMNEQAKLWACVLTFARLKASKDIVDAMRLQLDEDD